ncbi:MAG: hypothetical protein AAFO77_02560 [Pseudomonadota bacterium]
MMLRAFAVVASLCGATTAYAACPAPELGHVDIYPTANVLPENLLRLYVYYPRPMAANEGRANVRLLDADGSVIEGAFLPTREELWSPDRRRLTLLLDPGRVKKGLIASAALGPVLIAGQAYTFEVPATALDTNDCPLGTATAFRFTAGPSDITPPNPSEWTLTEPGAGTLDPLGVNLESAHDHLSLAFRLRVIDASGEIVPGRIDLSEAEANWLFVPRSPWKEAPYTLTIEDTLEDLAGNRPGTLFDRPAGLEPAPWQDKLPFTPGS